SRATPQVGTRPGWVSPPRPSTDAVQVQTRRNPMDDRVIKVAERCLHGAEDNSMTFPQIVGALMQAGFEGYAIDFRRATATYYLPDGDSIVLPTHRSEAPVAPDFDPPAVQAAIKEARPRPRIHLSRLLQEGHGRG